MSNTSLRPLHFSEFQGRHLDGYGCWIGKLLEGCLGELVYHCFGSVDEDSGCLEWIQLDSWVPNEGSLGSPLFTRGLH